jgi:DNA-binding NarL/FixJ family response regulator
VNALPEERIRVVLADDHPMFREGMRAVLDALPEMELVADVGTGADAVEVALAIQPDVVVMDVQMPDLNGIDATRRIVTASPHVAVLVLTMFDDDDSVFAAMRAGARGYLLKGADHAELARAIRAVANGEAIFGPSVARRVMGYFAAATRDHHPALAGLTPREREVLELVAQGRGNAEIARALAVSAKTVRNHVSNIFTKLQVADRTEAILRARQAGLGRAPDP